MRRLLPTGVAAIATLALLFVAATGIAVAYFTTTGSGSSSPKTVSVLSQPSIATAAPGAGGTVALSWATVSAPGIGSVTYTVKRNGEDAGGTCSATVSVTSCVDSGLKAGTYEYVVTARWRSWSAVGAGKAATVTVGPAEYFTLSAASLTPAAGASDNLTITAKDAGGGTVTTYTGSHDLVFSGALASPGGTAPTVSDSSGADVTFGDDTAISFSAGVATVSTAKNGAMKLYKSGATSLSVGDGSISAKTPLAVTVSAAAASKLVLTAATTTLAAGAANSLTTTAQDAYGNVATSYAGSKSLTFSGAPVSPGGTISTVVDSSGTAVNFGSATAIAFSAGVATVSSSKNGLMRLYASGEPDINVSDGSISTKAPLELAVSPLAASKFMLTAATATPTAGAADNLTTTAQDAYGNVATSYAGSKSLTFSGASASPGGTKPTVANSSGTAVNFGTATPISFTAGVAAITSATKNGVMKLYDAEEANIVVSDGTISSASAPLKVTVSAAVASKLVLAAATTTPAAGAADNLTTTAQDAYGNVATSYSGAKSITYSGALASPGGNIPTVSDSAGTEVAFGTATTINFSQGTATVSGEKNGAMKLYKSGATTITASDGTFTTATVSLTVATTATKLLLAAATTTPVAAAADNLTITALDPYGNTATTYSGAKSLVFSGSAASPNGTLPSVINSANVAINFGSATAINFTSGVAGVTNSRNGVMKLNRAGAAAIAVSDGTISNPTPLAMTVSPGAAARWGLTNISASAGTLSSNCLFACTLTGLGNSGKVTAKVAVTDSVGNTVSGVGAGHAAKVVVSGGAGSISGTPLAIPSTGAAESATTFTYTSRSSSTFTETVTASAAEGTAYTTATLTATK